MDYSTTSPAARPAERPNACDRCGSFRLINERYEAPTAHFAYCRNYVDQGVIRMAAPPTAAQRTKGQNR